jgi:hypothetical protein
MGLDAWVHCDCFERGCLKTLPPLGVQPHLEPDGGLAFSTAVDDLWFQFETWLRDYACEHPQMKLVSHRLGNIGLVALIRHELAPRRSEFPILFEKIMYNGCHAGDFVGVELLPSLEAEIKMLGNHSVQKSRISQWIQSWCPIFGRWGWWKLPSERNQLFLDDFRRQMEELIHAAKSVNKPICF